MRQKKSIENLDPKQASQKRDMNTHTQKKKNIKISQNYLRKIIDLLVFIQISARFMKDAYMIKCQNFLIISSQSISAVFERVTTHNVAF